jgi:hypothetical protein
VTISERLSAALAVRLNVQISASSLPVVDEAMDVPLGRWIDSAPMPSDSADGNDVRFEVRLASDFSQVAFAMHGLPGAVLPRLASYLGQSAMLPAEERVIDALGALQPPRIGSFISIEPGRLTTGWLVPTPLRLDAIAALVPAVSDSSGWRRLGELGISEVAGLRQAIGDDRHADLWLAPSGTGRQAAVAAAVELFEALGGGSLPAAVYTAALAGESPRVVTRVGGAPRVALSIAGGRRAALRAIAGEVGLRVDPGLDRIIATLGAGELDGIEYAVHRGRPEVFALIAPAGEDRPTDQAN